jgi:hypothetical protein
MMTPLEAVQIIQQAGLICRYCDIRHIIYGGGYRDRSAIINLIKNSFIIALIDSTYEVFFEKDNDINSFYDKNRKVINVSSLEEAVSLVINTIIPSEDIEAPKRDCTDQDIEY